MPVPARVSQRAADDSQSSELTQASLVCICAQKAEALRDLMRYTRQYLDLSGVGSTFVQMLQRIGIINKYKCVLDDRAQCLDLLVALKILCGFLLKTSADWGREK